MKNKNILMTEVRTYESLGDYTVKIITKISFEWISEDDLEVLFDEVNTPSISRSLLNGDMCRKIYSERNDNEIGSDDEVIKFIEEEWEKEMNEAIKRSEII